MTTTSYHEVRTQSPVLACDGCGALVDPSETGRAAHQAWHEQNDKVIDLTEQHELKLAEAS